MADKKSKDSEQPSADEELKRRVDEMMDIKGGKGKSPAIDPDAGISEVAASINQSLSHDLNQDEPSLTPAADDVPTATDSTPLPTDASQTAPELPDETTELPVEPIAEPEVEEPADSEPPADAVAADSADQVVEVEPKPLPDADVDDTYTQKAVDDIVAKESDELLAVEDKKNSQAAKAVVSKTTFGDKIRKLFGHRRIWLLVLIFALVIAAIPATRYKILGLFIKKSVTISVVDSKTSSPVSNANVNLGGSTGKTDANGKAVVKVGLGQRDLKVTKKFYKDYSGQYLVGFKATSTQVKFVATGRLVPVTVINKVSGKSVSGVVVQSQGTNAKTNSKGVAEIALPAKAVSYPGKIIANGYNPADIIITATDKTIKANTFEITPAGQVYFLSNRSGTLDVVKSNLDGSARKTVLAGTGKEDPRFTSLLASRDWRYLVLKAQREGSQPSLYLIDTKTDKTIQFDSGNSEFDLVGWSDHNFVYRIYRNDLGYHQTGKQALKSYNAERGQINVLDQSEAEGTAGNAAHQGYANFFILDNLIVYDTFWSKEPFTSTVDITAKKDTIRAIQPDGKNKKDYQQFPSAENDGIQATLFEPQGVYFAVYDKSLKAKFYVFENQTAKPSSIDQATFDKTYPTFLISPGGSSSFWAEVRDGKNTLFTGDSNAGNKKLLADSSEYAPYGWYSDDYLLVSKSSSELYILPVAGLNKDRQALKITDYYKPALNYPGYGYGYGGL